MEKKLTPEERAAAVEEMVRCVRMAADVWALIADKELVEVEPGIRMGDVHVDEVKALIAKDFRVPLSDERTNAIGYALASAMRDGIHSCGLWEFAHLLHHCLFDEDVPGRH